MKICKTVQTWMEETNRFYNLADEEWAFRLKVLKQFCEYIGKDPDSIIKEAKDARSEKLDYMRRLRGYVRTLGLSESTAHEHENVIRSFFIHNGARVVVKPYSDVYRRVEVE